MASPIDRKAMIRATRESRDLIPRSKPIPLLDVSVGHLACAHRGKMVSKSGCASCGSGVAIKVYQCAVHGQCSYEQPAGDCIKICRDCPDRSAAPVATTYIRASMGLGDMVLLTAVFRHIKAQRPGRRVGIITAQRFAPLFDGLADEVLVEGQTRIVPDIHLGYQEPRAGSTEVAATNVEINWLPKLKLTPDARSMGYHVPLPPNHLAAVDAYLGRIAPKDDDGRYPVAFIHYQGFSYLDRKNLSHDEALVIAKGVQAMGLIPVVHDLENLCPWAEREGIKRITREDGLLWCEEPSPSILTSAALMERSSLVIAIDSGPQKMAAGLTTPTVAVWTGWYPGHCIHPVDHMIHVVPTDLGGMTSDRRTDHFEQHYRAAYYPHRDQLAATVIEAAKTALQFTPTTLDIEAGSGAVVRREHRRCDTSIVRDVVHRDEYRLASLPTAKIPEFIIDIGAHIGAFAIAAKKKWREAKIVSVECNPANGHALEANLLGRGGVLMAACSYLDGTFELDDTVIPGSRNTGTSTLVAGGVRVMDSVHERGQRRALAVPVMTLEQIREAVGFPHVDLLKLDCEGSEENILRHADLTGIRMIVGEYHHRQRFLQIVRERFATGWVFKEFASEGGLGIFHLLNQTL